MMVTCVVLNYRRKQSDKKRAVLGRVRSRKNTIMSHARTLLQEKRLEGVVRPQYSSDLSVIATVHSVGLARSVTLKVQPTP